MPEEAAQKTEPATPKRREDARKRGQVAQSRDVQSVVVLGAAVLAFSSMLGAGLAEQMARIAQSAWTTAASPPGSLGEFHASLVAHFQPAALAMLPVMLVLAVAGGLSPILQSGPLLSGKALAPKAEHLSPLKGFKRMFHYDRLVDLAKALAKIVVVGGVAWWVIRSEVPQIIGLAGLPVVGSGRVTLDLAYQLAVTVLAVLVPLAGMDFAYQRWRHEQRLRMSKQEVREELRQREGDPQLRGRRRQMQRELSRSRMITEVASADVVVVNPTHFAVALRYERREMAAPEVVARGRGHVALRIREAARSAGVPIVENPPLARMLHQATRVGREIPEHLFQAVAEILAYVYRLDRRRRAHLGGAA